MNAQTNKRLAIIFVILAIASASPWWGNILTGKKLSKGEDEFKFSAYTKDNAEEISLKKGTSAVKLSKDGTVWKVASYSTSMAAVDKLFLGLKESAIERMVSRNKANWDEFGVATESGTILTLKANGSEKTYILGNIGPETGTFYARNADSDNVYLINGILADAIPVSVDEWRDKTIISLSKDGVNKIEVMGKNAFTVGKNKDGKWEITVGGSIKPVEESSAAAVLTNINPLEAYGFLDDANKKTFANSTAKMQIRISDKDGKVLADLHVLEKESDYWVEVKGKTDIHKVYGYKLQELLKLNGG